MLLICNFRICKVVSVAQVGGGRRSVARIGLAIRQGACKSSATRPDPISRLTHEHLLAVLCRVEPLLRSHFARDETEVLHKFSYGDLPSHHRSDPSSRQCTGDCPLWGMQAAKSRRALLPSTAAGQRIAPASCQHRHKHRTKAPSHAWAETPC